LQRIAERSIRSPGLRGDYEKRANERDSTVSVLRVLLAGDPL
jgi:hypothetical protein